MTRQDFHRQAVARSHAEAASAHLIASLAPEDDRSLGEYLSCVAVEATRATQRMRDGAAPSPSELSAIEGAGLRWLEDGSGLVLDGCPDHRSAAEYHAKAAIEWLAL